jgi:hypothetical protein
MGRHFAIDRGSEDCWRTFFGLTEIQMRVACDAGKAEA